MSKFSTCSGVATWSCYLRVTVYEGQKPAYPGPMDTEELKREIADELGGENFVRLVGTKETPFSADERKGAIASFKKFLEGKGIKQIPKSKDHQCVCILCGRVARCNATEWLLHAATKCPDHPDKAAAARQANTLKSTSALVGTVQRTEIAELAEEYTTKQLSATRKMPSVSTQPSVPSRLPLPSVAGSSAASPAVTPNIVRHLDRKLTTDEVALVDEMLARFCFAEGTSFRLLKSPYLRAALAKLSPSWAEKTTLSQWNLSHGFLNSECDRIEMRVQEALRLAPVRTLQSSAERMRRRRSRSRESLPTPDAGLPPMGVRVWMKTWTWSAIPVRADLRNVPRARRRAGRRHRSEEAHARAAEPRALARRAGDRARAGICAARARAALDAGPARRHAGT